MTSNRTFGWPGLMTVTTAAEYLEMHSRSLEDLQSKGLVTPVDSGKGKRYSRAELDRYIEELEEWSR